MSMAIPDFSQLQVIVVGDLMLDQYWFGPASRISPEAPVPVVRVTRSEARAGGAANVAMNLVSLGVKTTCCGVVGDDDTGADLKGLLEVEGISAALAKSERHPTITKLRVLSQNQQLIRLDTEQLYSAADAAAVAAVAAGQLSKTTFVFCLTTLKVVWGRSRRSLRRATTTIFRCWSILRVRIFSATEGRLF